MLGDYQIDQPIVCKILKNAIFYDRISHAYLIEANGYINKNQFAISLAKFLMCPKHHFEEKEIEKFCPICHKKELNNFLDISIIKPNGLCIKKNQLGELQKKFSTKSFENNKKIYIIQDAELLNISAANSILKFLEEPESNIIAILIVDNLYQLLPTIISRCQILRLKNHILTNKEESSASKIRKILNMNDELENLSIKINKVLEFIEFYEKNRNDTLLHLNQLWFSVFMTKEDFLKGFNLVMYVYKDVLNELCNRNLDIFVTENEIIKNISKKNTVEVVCDKIKIISDTIKKVSLNLNLNLLMDDFIHQMEGVK